MHKARYLVYGLALAAGVFVLAAATQAIAAGFGFGVTDNASAKDVGLPFYPGARPHKEDKKDSNAANLWGAFGSYGMKIVAVTLDTGDAPPKVAPFYTAALAKYGPVIDCSYGKKWPPRSDNKSNRLDCGDDKPEPGQIVFKAGNKHEFHVVGIEPQAQGSQIALVYIQMRGFD